MPEEVMYGTEVVKLGMFEELYYTSVQKYEAAYSAGKLHQVPERLDPKEYLNTTYGFMFRFPFPDEDKLDFGKIKELYDREIPITLSKAVYDKYMGADHDLKAYQLSLVFQKPVHRRSDGKFCHALIFRDCATESLYRMEEDREVNVLVKEIVRNHISQETDPSKKAFYKNLAVRVLKGYRLERSQEKRQAEKTTISTSLPPSAKNEHKAAGIKDSDNTAEKKKRIRVRKRF